MLASPRATQGVLLTNPLACTTHLRFCGKAIIHAIDGVLLPAAAPAAAATAAAKPAAPVKAGGRKLAQYSTQRSELATQIGISSGQAAIQAAVRHVQHGVQGCTSGKDGRPAVGSVGCARWARAKALRCARAACTLHSPLIQAGVPSSLHVFTTLGSLMAVATWLPRLPATSTTPPLSVSTLA